MKIPLAFTLGAGTVVGALLLVDSAVVTRVQAQQVASGTPNAPRLTDDEFQRLYDRMIGSWHFQHDKSTETEPGVAPRLRWYVTYEPDGDRAIRYTNRNVEPDGKETVSSSRQVLDGSLSGGSTIARLPLSEHIISTTIMSGGTPQARNTQVFSTDGQRMTVIHRRVDERGEHIWRVHVWDRIDGIPD